MLENSSWIAYFTDTGSTDGPCQDKLTFGQSLEATLGSS